MIWSFEISLKSNTSVQEGVDTGQSEEVKNNILIV